MSGFTRGFLGRRRDDDGRLPPGQYLTDDFPVLSAGPTPQHPARPLAVHRPHRDRRRATTWTWQELMALPAEDVDGRHPLRHPLVASWTPLAGRVTGHPARRRRDGGRLRAGALLRRLHHQPAARGPARRPGLGRLPSTTATTSPPSTAGRPGCWCRTSTSGSRPSGSAASTAAARTSPGSGSSSATTTTATHGASSGTRATDGAAAPGGRPCWWSAAPETAERVARWCSTCPAGRVTCAGQHVDVRLTAQDGYQARSAATRSPRRPTATGSS